VEREQRHHPRGHRVVRRREFLRLSSLAGASGLLWACAPTAQAPAQPTEAPKAAATTAPAAKPAEPKPTAAPAVAKPAEAAKPTEAAKPAEKPAAAAEPSGTLTIAQGADITSLDPQQTQGSAPRAMIAAMFDQLVTLDWDFKVAPWVAASWQNLDDRTWQFNLRRDVEFHSGEKLTGASVKWSIERFVAPETKNIYASTLQQIEQIDLVDDYTVKLTTKEPYPGLLEAMASYFYLSPPETMQKMGEEYFKNPVGSGPYKFVEWVPGERFVQEAAKPHFSGDPKVKTVVWKTISEGAARVTALRTGAADIIHPVTPQDMQQISGGGMQAIQAKAQGLMCLVMNASTPPLDDKRVRQALNYAVDKDQIIKVLLGGVGEPINGPLTFAHEGYDPSLPPPYPYDPDKAKALLAEAGLPNGFRIRFDTPSGRYLQDKQVAEAIAGQWRRIGVEAEVNPLEWGAFLREAQQKQWQLFLITQGSGGTQVLLSTCFSSTVKGIPWLGYANPRVDDLIDRAGRTMDTQQRVQMYRDIVNTVREDAPWVFLHQLYDIYGVQDRVQNWKPGSGIILLRGTSVKS
jgi:peptide/nickel transport system substrate-binding protein